MFKVKPRKNKFFNLLLILLLPAFFSCGIPEAGEALKNPRGFKEKLQSCADLKIYENLSKLYLLDKGQKELETALAGQDRAQIENVFNSTMEEANRNTEAFLFLKFFMDCEKMEAVAGKLFESMLRTQMEAEMKDSVEAAAQATEEAQNADPEPPSP